LNPNVSKEFDALIKKAMAKQPQDRFQSAKEFLGALKVALRSMAMLDRSAITVRHVDEVYTRDETLELPGRISDSGSWREEDIAAWQHISHSQDTADFTRYLETFPEGGFVELAKTRIVSLQKAALLAAEQDRRSQQETREIKEKAEAEARLRRQQEMEERAQWVHRLIEIKKEAEEARKLDAMRREQRAQEQARRARAFSSDLSERVNKFVRVVAEREAANELERRMRRETRRKLEDEVRRKKQGRQKLISMRESAEVRAEIEARARIQKEQAEQTARNEAYAKAKAQAEEAERLKNEAEMKAAQEQQQANSKMFLIGIFLLVLMMGILFGLLPLGR
jgi:hypothetical protein